MLLSIPFVLRTGTASLQAKSMEEAHRASEAQRPSVKEERRGEGNGSRGLGLYIVLAGFAIQKNGDGWKGGRTS